MHILLAEDDPQTQSFMSKHLNGAGHEVTLAENGQEALELAKTVCPDLILMDVMMPVMSGLEATEAIKKEQRAHNYWVPIIMLSALSDEDHMLRGLAIGADDYLPKPVNFKMLDAKLRANQRVLELQQKLWQTTQELSSYIERFDEEQETAEKLMLRITQARQVSDERITLYRKPAELFSGDLVTASKVGQETTNVLVADATGHGLGAALSMLHLSQPFYEMSEAGYRVGHIIQKMNELLSNNLPINYFAATTLASVDFSQQMIEIWQGGNPTAYFINDAGVVLKTFDSTHPVIGIDASKDFDIRTHFYQWQEPGYLFVYSDGLPEARDKEGGFLGKERSLELMVASAQAQSLAPVEAGVAAFRGEAAASDDLSVAMIRCDVNQ